MAGEMLGGHHATPCHPMTAKEPLPGTRPPTTRPWRAGCTRRRRRDRRRRDRVTDHGEPRRLPPSKSPRPATLFRTRGSDLRLDAGRCDRLAASFATPLHPGRALSDALRAGSPCTRPLPGGIALLGPPLQLRGCRTAATSWKRPAREQRVHALQRTERVRVPAVPGSRRGWSRLALPMRFSDRETCEA